MLKENVSKRNFKTAGQEPSFLFYSDIYSQELSPYNKRNSIQTN